MIETTTTARTKWCPMVRQVWAEFDAAGSYKTKGDTPPFNAVHENHGHRERRLACIADACMMWQSLGTLKGEGGSVPVGYCGLAGRPPTPGEREEIVSAVQALPVERPESEAA